MVIQIGLQSVKYYLGIFLVKSASHVISFAEKSVRFDLLSELGLVSTKCWVLRRPLESETGEKSWR